MTAHGPRPTSAAARVADDVARRHGVTGVPAEPTWRGATSDVFAGDDAVVKVAHPRPDAVAALRTDVAVTRVVAAHGVRVPAVLAYGETAPAATEHATTVRGAAASVEHGPVAWAVLARVPGVTIERAGRRSAATGPSWRAVGEQLALVHAIRQPVEPSLRSLRVFRQAPDNDPRAWLAQLVSAGVVRPEPAGRLRRRLDAAAGAVRRVPPVLCHGDVNAANVVLDPGHPERVTLLDWAGAGWLDPVWDLASAPLAAVPSLLDGHRTRRPLPDDATAALRLTWCRAQLVLRRALDDAGPRPPAQRRAAVERELAELLDARLGG